MAQPALPVQEDVVLRPWSSQDARVVKRAFDDSDIRLWHTRRLDTDAEASAWIESWNVHAASSGAIGLSPSNQ